LIDNSELDFIRPSWRQESDGVEPFARSGWSGWKWTSEGAGGYETEPASTSPGTKIILELKDDAKDFTKDWRLQEVIRRLFEFHPFPIELNGKHLNTVQASGRGARTKSRRKTYNELTIRRPRFDNPLYRLHFNADAPLHPGAALCASQLRARRIHAAESEVNLYCGRC